jgi:hypothetical protein
MEDVMLIPDYWSEARVRHRDNKRQITVKRWGWSLKSEADAQAMAQSRAEEALQRILRGEKLNRSEAKVAYNGAVGSPIREEVIARQNGAVITRNSYGALCLNSSNVLIADVDLPESRHSASMVEYLVVLVIACLGGYYLGSIVMLIAIFVIASFLYGLVRAIVNRKLAPSIEEKRNGARERVVEFANSNIDWAMRVYETPNGLRVIATHRFFEPNENEVIQFFDAIHADPVYRLMCRNQACFRARLTAKPWRIGIPEHMRPRPGVWPVTGEKLKVRQAWVDVYNQKTVGFAACRYLESLGTAKSDPQVEAVVQLHDELSQANSSLPLA